MIRSFRCSLNKRQPLIEDTLISGREHLATVGHALLTEMQLSPSDASGNDSGKCALFSNKRVVTSMDLWQSLLLVLSGKFLFVDALYHST